MATPGESQVGHPPSQTPFSWGTTRGSLASPGAVAAAIVDPGDGPFAEGDLILRDRFAAICQSLASRGLRPPSAELTVRGLGVRGAPR
jgi:hypothetical protein